MAGAHVSSTANKMVQAAHCLAFCLLVLSVTYQVLGDTRYEPNWDSLDTRPLPLWFDEAKFGVFISWGLYAVPGFGDEWFWYNWISRKQPDVVKFMQDNYPPDFTYAGFAPMLKAELFDPEEWADIIEASGAKYVTLISKHCSGWTLWPSATSWNWNSVDTGPHMDLVGAVAKAIKGRPDLHFGIYFSQYEWYNHLYLQDKNNSFKTQNYVKEVTNPQMYELVNNYQPEVIYSDGEWEANYTYWNSTQFLAWLYNDSPVKDTVVVNDRWGNTRCQHGDYYDCSDRYHPTVLQKHKYESGATIDKKSWGYRRNTNFTTDFLTIDNLIWQLVSTVSCGGNLLVNIGIPPDGKIIPIFEERLRQMGSWLNISGEAIYKTKPWTYQNDTLNNNVWYTQRPDTGAVYATLTQKYQSKITLGNIKLSSSSKVSLLGYEGEVTCSTGTNNTVEITMPPLPLDTNLKWAWTFKFENAVPRFRE